jgi:hypothetical protein
VRVSYRAEPGAQPQEREIDFNFALTEEQHRLILWYLEEYLLYPWDEFVNRAKRMEELDSIEGHIARVVYGKKIGDSVFRRISAIAGILVWAEVCEHAPGELVLVD